MKPETIKAIVMLAVAALIFAAGWAVEGWRMGAEIARIKQAQAGAIARAASKNAADLAAANQRGDALSLQLAGWENTLTAFAQEKERELSRLTVGRPCLDRAVVGLLNQPTGLKQPRPVPETASESVRADAAFATDTDVGTWISGAQRSYETCRGRLNAIDEFYAGENLGTE